MEWWRLSDSEKEGFIPRILREYDEEYCRASDIARRYEMSTATLYKILKKHGVNTNKGRRYEAKCSGCGAVVRRSKSLMRGRKRFFCDRTCYYEWVSEIGGNGYTGSRHGQRLGRAVVGKHFDLTDGMVVHHEDRNTLNNAPYNLRVFRNHSEHMSYHRGGDGRPIWDGEKDAPFRGRFGSWGVEP